MFQNRQCFRFYKNCNPAQQMQSFKDALSFIYSPILYTNISTYSSYSEVFGDVNFNAAIFHLTYIFQGCLFLKIQVNEGQIQRIVFIDKLFFVMINVIGVLPTSYNYF